ncbi:MAG: trypco2 family protein [Gallionella sp.]|nr:trypco2 family protein [Gallionella sp.]
MKGNISIGDFIHQVKKELVAALDKPGDPFYELEEVNLEISFALEAGVGTKMNFYVVELGGDTTATQTHKVSLKLVPLGTSRSYFKTSILGKTKGAGRDKPVFDISDIEGAGTTNPQRPLYEPPKID